MDSVEIAHHLHGVMQGSSDFTSDQIRVVKGYIEKGDYKEVVNMFCEAVVELGEPPEGLDRERFQSYADRVREGVERVKNREVWNTCISLLSLPGTDAE